ncbi:unnamed protein product, partial [marine sediment metagenome]
MSPQIGFSCPDGDKIKFEDCLKKCCMKNRCLSLPTLKKMSQQRIWEGVPSTTQLINGIRYILLTTTKDFYQSPQDMAFALLGTKFHASLEDDEFIMEKKCKSKNMTGTFDFYSPETKTLWDYKTSGGYKVKKALGLISRKISDPSGERYKTSGKGYKKGDIKKINEWYQNPNEIDAWEWELQLNRYRLWVEEAGYKVDSMKIEATIRDGGTIVATKYGLKNNIYIIPIKRLPDTYVLDFFNKKAKALKLATAIGWAETCNDRESWGGKRCEKYCSI